MKIGIIGANGQLGADICKVFKEEGHTVVPFTHSNFGIEQYELMMPALESQNLDVIINTSAAHHLQQCENNANKAFEVNALGARNLALLSKKLGFKLVHISTDYVFDGKQCTPYQENDLPNPLNVYGISKLAGEHFIESILKSYLIIRTASLFGNNPCRAKGGLNFVQLMLKLAREGKPISVVEDQYSSPTNTLDLAIQIEKMVISQTGLFHVVNDGGCSWFEFAQTIFELKGLFPDLSPKKFQLDPNEIQRPKYSVLNTAKLSQSGVHCMRHWKLALKDYLNECS